MNILLIFVASATILFPDTITIHSSADSLASVKANGRMLIATAGFAPVPAFSFNHPLVIGFLSLQKKRFSYEPDFSLGLNGKAWMANNWFRFKISDKRKLKFSTGINPSFYFSCERMPEGHEIINAHRNFTWEAVSEYAFSRVW